MEGQDDALKYAALRAHKAKRGKIEIIGKVPIDTMEELSLYYTPGVAYPSLAIKDDKNLSYEYTSRANTIAILTDGTRVLGLGRIGPYAGMPVMEGKALLLKRFGCVDAVPLAVALDGEDQMVDFAKAIEPSFGAINLEDIEMPRAINVLRRLEKELDIPVFHDDSHGTGIVVYAALKNALKVVGKRLKEVNMVVNGAGSAGTGIANLLLAAGAQNVVICDTAGILYRGRHDDMNAIKAEIAERTNTRMLKGTLADACEGADVLIGVSRQGAFSSGLIKSMAQKPIVFALANPYPEIEYKDAKSAGAAVVATGRSDTPNQVNNMLAFPGIFRGVLDVRASRIDSEMMLAAGDAMASSVKRSQLNSEHIVPSFSDGSAAARTTARVAAAVADAAMRTGAARLEVDPKAVSSSYIRAVRRYKKIERLVNRLD